MSLTACHTKKQATVSQVSQPATHTSKPDTTLIPAFSGEVLYLFGREYVAIHDSLSHKFHHPYAARVRHEQRSMMDYVEQRLQEWYPDIAYKGMVQKWNQIALMIANVPDNAVQLFVNREFGKQRTNGQFYHAASDMEEAVMLQMTVEEQAFFDQLNRLATADTFALRNSLPQASYAIEREISQNFTPDIHESFEQENILTSLMLAGGPYALYRVLLSKQRAERQAKMFYGADTNSGKQGDAFKHMYVNVLLRAYTSKEIAKFVMDDVWELWHVNAPCDRYMDLHNNQIGRNLRYWDFHQNTNDWKEWGKSVQQFVQDSVNSSFKEWDKETVQFKVLQDSRNTPETQYIFWNKEQTDTVSVESLLNPSAVSPVLP